MNLPPKKNWKLLIFAAEPLIFAPPYPSRVRRGEVNSVRAILRIHRQSEKEMVGSPSARARQPIVSGPSE